MYMYIFICMYDHVHKGYMHTNKGKYKHTYIIHVHEITFRKHICKKSPTYLGPTYGDQGGAY